MCSICVIMCYLFSSVSFVSTEFTEERELICYMAPVNDFANEFYRSIEQPLIEPPEKRIDKAECTWCYMHRNKA